VSYTALSAVAVAVVVVLDLAVIRTRLLIRKVFWTAYAIIVAFQLLSNAILTGLRVVRYNGEAIIGSSTPPQGAPPFLGDGRIAFAPVEDLVFGFALVLLTLVLWVFWGRLGIGRTPMAGPPRLLPRRASHPQSPTQRDPGS